MKTNFLSIVNVMCSADPMLESAIRAGYRAYVESERGPIFEEDVDGDDGDTVTMSLDSIADNADQIQAVLQKKKLAKNDSDAADEQLIALGNASNGTV